MRKTILMIAFLAIAQLGFSQIYFEQPIKEDSALSFKDRVYFGGNFSLNLGNFTFIDASPLAGYMVTDDFSVGAGIGYTFVSRELILLPGPRFQRISNSSYGARVFARQNVFEDFFAHVEYETINTRFISNTGDGTVRGWVPGFLVGGGRTFGAFTSGGANIMALINLLHDDARSPYNSPLIIRVGVTF